MFTPYQPVKRSVAESDPLQCEQQQVLCWDGSIQTSSHDPFLRIRFLLAAKIGSCEHTENDLPTHGSVIKKKKKTNGNRTCSIFIRQSSWKRWKAPTNLSWAFWCQIEDSLLNLKIGSCEHTTNDLPTFSPQKRNLEIGPSQLLLPIFGTNNGILEIGSCELAFTPFENGAN